MGNDRKKGEEISDGEGAVVHRVFREVSGGISYPILIKTNYSDLALLMKVKLKVRALWSVVEKGGANVEEMIALNMLGSAVQPEMEPSIVKMETVKKAWDAIATMRVRDDRVNKSTTQQLRRKFDMATCGDKETVEDYTLCLDSLAAHLATLGKVVKETQIVEKMLHGLPSWFKHIIISIKTLLDVSTMSVVDLTGHLKEMEEAIKEPLDTMQQEGELYLMEEEWDAWRKKRKAANGLDGG
jgi:hypothetical protein